jgi:hypothetical protein
MEKVDSLKKIEMFLEAGTTPNKMDITSQPVKEQFIFGIASDGLTPFECEMADKSPGEVTVLQLNQTQITTMFGHLAKLILDNIEMRDSFYLKVKIIDIVTPENREVVNAIAESLKHGDGCECGCGCG